MKEFLKLKHAKSPFLPLHMSRKEYEEGREIRGK
jgi:hypothetical protein